MKAGKPAINVVLENKAAVSRFVSESVDKDRLLSHWKKRVTESASFLEDALLDQNLYCTSKSGCRHFSCPSSKLSMTNITDQFCEDLSEVLKAKGIEFSAYWCNELGDLKISVSLS